MLGGPPPCGFMQPFVEAFHWQQLRWPGDSQRESERFARIDGRETLIFIVFERFARIAFAICSALKRDSQQKKGSIREP